MTSLLDELDTSYENTHYQEKMTVSNMSEKMSEKVPDEISPVEKGSTKKFRIGLADYY